MNAPTDFTALKTRQQAAWASGDYAVIGTTLQIVGEQLAEACDLRWDERVLDVAAGNGNATLAAARRGCRVTSTDYVRRCSSAAPSARAPSAWTSSSRSADAEALPFARRQLRRRAVHLRRDVRARPCALRRRDGARVPLGRAHRHGQLDARGLHRPAVQDARPPPAAARRARSRRRCGARRRTCSTLFGDAAAKIDVTPRIFNFRYRSAAHFIDVFRTWYGPVHKAFAALPAEKGAALERDLTELLNGLNHAGTSRWSCRANTSRSSSHWRKATTRAATVPHGKQPFLPRSGLRPRRRLPPFERQHVVAMALADGAAGAEVPCPRRRFLRRRQESAVAYRPAGFPAR